MEHSFPVGCLDIFVGQQFVQRGAGLGAEERIERALRFLARIEQDCTCHDDARSRTASRRLGLLFRHEFATQPVAEFAADQVVIAFVGACGTRRLVELTRLDEIHQSGRADRHSQRVAVFAGRIVGGVAGFDDLSQPPKSIIPVSRLILIEIHRARRRGQTEIIIGLEDQCLAAVPEVNRFTKRISVKQAVVVNLPDVALINIGHPGGRNCQRVQRHHRVAVSVVFGARRNDVGGRLGRIDPGPAHREIADGDLAHVASAESFVVVVKLGPRNHDAVFMLDFGAFRQTNDPLIQVQRVFGDGDSLVVKSGAVAIDDEAIIRQARLIAVSVVAKLRFQSARRSLAQFLDLGLLRDGMNEADIGAVGSRHQHDRR